MANQIILQFHLAMKTIIVVLSCFTYMEKGSIAHYQYWGHNMWTAKFVRSQIARFMGLTCGPLESCRPQMGPMLAPWTLLSGMLCGQRYGIYQNLMPPHSFLTWIKSYRKEPYCKRSSFFWALTPLHVCTQGTHPDPFSYLHKLKNTRFLCFSH